MRGACIQCAQLSLASERPEDGSGVTEFGSFDNSTCKRVLDLLKPGDLTQVHAIKLHCAEHCSSMQ